MTLITQPIRIVVVGAACIKGLEWIALGLAIMAVIRVVVYYPHLRSVFAVTMRELGIMIGHALAPCIVSAAASWLVMTWAEPSLGMEMAFVLASCAGLLVWVPVVYLVKHPIQQHISEALDWARERIGLGRSGGSEGS